MADQNRNEDETKDAEEKDEDVTSSNSIQPKRRSSRITTKVANYSALASGSLKRKKRDKSDAPTSTGPANVSMAARCPLLHPFLHFCDKCGDLFQTNSHLVQHEKICRTKIYGNFGDDDEAQGSRNANDADENALFVPPAAKRPVPVKHVFKDPSSKKSTEPAIVAASARPEAARAMTQTVLRNLPSFLIQKPLLNVSAPVNANAGPLDQNVTLPPSIHNTSTQDTDRIQQRELPLSTAIFTRSLQDPNELMLIWSQKFEDDLLLAVKMNSAHSILCIKELDIRELTPKQNEILRNSEMINFTMLDGNDAYIPWTVVSFGPGHSPVALKNKLFKSFVDAEKMFTELAESRHMILHNIMKCDGLFPILSNKLQKKITGFNL